MEESIYNLVPIIPELPPKQRMHRSKFDPTVPPSYSTFPKKEHPAGMRDGSASMLFAGRSGAIGRDVGPEVDPKRFLKAHSDKRGHISEPNKFERPRIAPPKERVPSLEDKPVMGLMTEKNFVHSNAVEAMCSAAKQKGPRPQELATQRPTFGQTPAYLNRMKAQIDAEKTMLAHAQASEAEYQASMKAQYVREVAEQEKEELIAALRARWEEKHRQYHSLPFAQDTAMSIVRKEGIERELKEIETALGKLSKKVVVVYNDSQGPAVANWAKSTAIQDASATASRMVNDSIAQKQASLASNTRR